MSGLPRLPRRAGRRARQGALALLLALTSTACDEDATTPAPPPQGPAPGFADVFSPGPDLATAPRLSPRALLVRLSLDLRGVRPTVEEFDALEADPEGELPRLVEAFLADPRFPDRVRDHYATVLRTRVEDPPVPVAPPGADDPRLEALIAASIGEEPLMVLARVAAEDRPYTELVTADWTMADEHLAALYPLDTPPIPLGWRPAQYTDGRPPAGLLSTNGLWWRYLSDGVSYGRTRANAVARIFLCADFLGRPIDFPRDIDLTDEAGVRDAIRHNEGCVGCHAGLDPLASYLAGFQYASLTATELARYHPERERHWTRMTGQPPAFYGSPGHSLADLGHQIAADPRFITCAVEQAFTLLMRRPPNRAESAELDALTGHREAFLAGGLTVRALFRTIVSDPRYALADPAEPPRVIPPEVWADTLEDLTGFRLTADGADLLATDRTGVRVLAGGGDGRAGADPAALPTATMSLVWERTAEAAALYAVDHGPTPPDARALFIIPTDRPPLGAPASDPAMQAQAAHLHRRLFGRHVAADSLEVEATLALWETLFAIEGDARRAWAGVLTALLRDPEMVFY